MNRTVKKKAARVSKHTYNIHTVNIKKETKHIYNKNKYTLPVSTPGLMGCRWEIETVSYCFFYSVVLKHRIILMRLKHVKFRFQVCNTIFRHFFSDFFFVSRFIFGGALFSREKALKIEVRLILSDPNRVQFRMG